jgi:soluble lytic murein transglycosylase-like protein
VGPTGDDVNDDRLLVKGGERGPTWDRLEDQLGWYDSKSIAAQRAYKRVKLVQLIVGAAVPVVAALQVSAVVTAMLAAFVFIAECAQQLYQWQTDWVLYRTTANALKHEKYLYLAAAGPYSGDDRHRVLAERIEDLVSQEHVKWTEIKRGEGSQKTASFLG